MNAIEGLKVAVDPDMTSMAIVSDDPSVNVLAVASMMEKVGWVMERQQLPESLHVSNRTKYYTLIIMRFLLTGYLVFGAAFYASSARSQPWPVPVGSSEFSERS